jgi:hypothetical protein
MDKKQFVLIVFGILALAALLFGYTHRANAGSVLSPATVDVTDADSDGKRGSMESDVTPLPLFQY